MKITHIKEIDILDLLSLISRLILLETLEIFHELNDLTHINYLWRIGLMLPYLTISPWLVLARWTGALQKKVFHFSKIIYLNIQ